MNPPMDADEKLMALKKAYADIILGISKEAAARVVASEKKSARYQHELKATKEEGARMLMRLKQMMDTQISEAEVATLSQQQKIEELEAQLQEAEDIVRDLRDNLEEVQCELERKKRENSHHVIKPGNDYLVEILAENKTSSHESCEYLPPNKSSEDFSATVPYSGKRNECRKCYAKIICICGVYSNIRELPSIILRGKDHGLYRNGCTQRIHACKRNILDRDMRILEETGKVTDKKNDLEHMQDRHSSDSEAPTSGGEILTELEKKLFPGIDVGNLQSFPQKRKRGNRRKQADIPLAREEYSLLQNPDHLPISSEAGDPTPFNVNAPCVEDPSDIYPRLSKDENFQQTQLDCTQASEGGPNIVEICDSSTPMDGGMNEKVVPLWLMSRCLESLPTDSVRKADVSCHNIELNSFDITKGLSGRHIKERVFRYTFQRKRKRRALVATELNGSWTEKKTGNLHIVDLKQEQPQPSFLEESSRDHSD